MNKILYFATSTDPDGTSSTEEVVMIPYERFSHAEMGSNTSMVLYFNAVTETHENNNYTYIELTITDKTHKSVMRSISKAINDAPSDGFVVIADDSYDQEFVNNNITAVGITVADMD